LAFLTDFTLVVEATGGAAAIIIITTIHYHFYHLKIAVKLVMSILSYHPSFILIF
jgi:hypothetical protein